MGSGVGHKVGNVRGGIRFGGGVRPGLCNVRTCTRGELYTHTREGGCEGSERGTRGMEKGKRDEEYCVNMCGRV